MANFKKISIKTNFIACFHQNLHQCLVTATITAGESAWDSWKYGSLSPGKTAKMAVESTFPAGKCRKFPAKWFTFPGRTEKNGKNSQ